MNDGISNHHFATFIVITDHQWMLKLLDDRLLGNQMWIQYDNLIW